MANLVSQNHSLALHKDTPYPANQVGLGLDENVFSSTMKSYGHLGTASGPQNKSGVLSK